MQIVVRIGNLALGVVVTAIVVRTLGRAGYGQWSTLFIVIGLIGYFANFGMEGVALREAARSPELEHEWIGAVIMLRLIMLGPVMLISLVALLLLEQSHQMLIAGLILIVAMPFGGVGALGLLFQLRVDNRVPMIVLTLRSILWGLAVVLIAWLGGGMIALAVAMAGTNSIGSIVQAVAAIRMVPRWPRPSRKHLRQLVGIGLPIGLAGVLVIAYARIDQVLVYSIAGSKQAGLYGAVYNVLDQSHFVPISIMTTLAPVLAASWPGDRERLLRTARLTAELLAIASFGALAFAIVAADPVVRLIFGAEFAPAASILPVLGGAFVLICFGYLNGNLLLVLGLQRRLLRISLIALVVNLIGNVILIPPFGYKGAAWMTLVTEAVVFAAAFRMVLGALELRRPRLGRIGRTAIAAALLGLALGALRIADASLAVLVVTACLCYPALLVALRAFGADDVRLLLRRGAPA
ncbi:MAG: polysaccharide biosynthesis protein [Solirubrobacterales bacterium]|nr:polysaccharide biosynthesis protein [Solirubrobacterales bacterium]